MRYGIVPRRDVQGGLQAGEPLQAPAGAEGGAVSQLLQHILHPGARYSC